MSAWFSEYVAAHKAALDTVSQDEVRRVAEALARALSEDRQIFVFGNGGSAANASHFATDLGKGASDKLGKRFRVLSLNDNVSWLTALGNDYAYEDVFVRQLENYGRPGDIALTMSVSGNSPNCVKALAWARTHGLTTVALLGGNRGRLADHADHALTVHDTHYGRVEDAHMMICHMLCYIFMEEPALVGGQAFQPLAKNLSTRAA